MSKAYITAEDINDSYKLEALPEDFECQVCFIVRDDMLMCSNCRYQCCFGCLSGF